MHDCLPINLMYDLTNTFFEEHLKTASESVSLLFQLEVIHKEEL